MNKIQLMLRSSILSFTGFIGLFSLTPQGAYAQTTSPTPTFWNQKSKSKPADDPEPPIKPRKAGSRPVNQICLISPDAPSQPRIIWNTKPFFLWTGKISKIAVGIPNKEYLKTQIVTGNQSVNYTGQALEPGKTYRLSIFLSELDNASPSMFIPFKIMEAPKRNRIGAELKLLNGSIFTSSYIEAVGYAANRGADVINLSLGAMLPTDVEELAFSQILQQNPKLVIVASSGNSNHPRVAYPSGYDGVLSVGASNLFGDTPEGSSFANRAYYSNHGKGLDVVAPGGDLSTSARWLGGIPTTGGTWMNKFWKGLAFPNSRWSPTIDFKGKYWWMQGTSFSSPAVAGVVALMKGEDTDGKFNREQLVNILKSTASYDNLKISEPDKKSYRTVVNKGLIPSSVTEKQFFFGSGLVNADAAVRAVKK